MSSNDQNWNALADLWRRSHEEVNRASVEELLASHRWRLSAVVGTEVLMLLVLVWMSWARAADGVEPWELVWLVTLWSFVAVAFVLAWWNRRGTWTTIAETVAEYRLQRGRRRRRSLHIASALFVAETIVVSAELAWYGRFGMIAVLALGTSALVFTIWAAWMRRQIQADLQ